MEKRPLLNRYGRHRMFLLVMCLLIFYPAAGLGFKQYNRVVKYDKYFQKYKLFDRLTPFDTSKQLADKNTAVGIVVGSIFIGMGTAIGLVIGTGLN